MHTYVSVSLICASLKTRSEILQFCAILMWHWIHVEKSLVCQKLKKKWEEEDERNNNIILSVPASFRRSWLTCRQASQANKQTNICRFVQTFLMRHLHLNGHVGRQCCRSNGCAMVLAAAAAGAAPVVGVRTKWSSKWRFLKLLFKCQTYAATHLSVRWRLRYSKEQRQLLCEKNRRHETTFSQTTTTTWTGHVKSLTTLNAKR